MLLQKIVEQSIHYKVGQELLQSGEVNLLQSGSFIIAK